MGKSIFVRCVALIGCAASLCGTVAAYSTFQYHRDVAARVSAWCAERPACVTASFESSLDEPLVTLEMRSAKMAQRFEDIKADMSRFGIFETPASAALPMLKTKAARLKLSQVQATKFDRKG